MPLAWNLTCPMLSKSEALTSGAIGSHVHDMATFAYVGVADPKTTLGGVVIPIDVAIVWLEVQDLLACFGGPQEVRYLCKAVHGHESIITWSFKARHEDKGTGAHDMSTCPLARLSPRG